MRQARPLSRSTGNQRRQPRGMAIGEGADRLTVYGPPPVRAVGVALEWALWRAVVTFGRVRHATGRAKREGNARNGDGAGWTKDPDALRRRLATGFRGGSDVVTGGYRSPFVAGPVHPDESLSSRRSVAYKRTAEPRLARGLTKRSPAHPTGAPCADSGHPRAARRGRLVVEGLRTGTPDAESPAHTTWLQLGNPRGPRRRSAPIVWDRWWAPPHVRGTIRCAARGVDHRLDVWVTCQYFTGIGEGPTGTVRCGA